MAHRPRVVAFDIIETTFALDSLRQRLAARGLPESTLELLFLRTLRDAFALAATDVYVPFTDIASDTLRGLCVAHGVAPDAEKDAAVLSGFGELDPQQDARAALEAARAAGLRVIALSNGAEESTRQLLDRAGFSDFFEQVLSIAEVRKWKPFAPIYRHAAEAAGVAPQELALVAVHAWDLHGAKHAGLTTAFVARGQPFPSHMAPPDATGQTLPEAIAALAALPAASLAPIPRLGPA